MVCEVTTLSVALCNCTTCASQAGGAGAAEVTEMGKNFPPSGPPGELGFFTTRGD
jgi:hypothetical protein